MLSMKKLVLGAALAIGAIGFGANKAQAAEFGVYVGGPVAYASPCPGPGYVWANGYWAGRRWFPGRWNFVGIRRPAPVVGYGYYHRGFAPRYAPYRR